MKGGIEVDQELTDRIRVMRAHFVVPPSTEEIFAAFDAATLSLTAAYEPVVKAFRHSLSATLSTVTIPFALASSSTEQTHFQRIHIAERIRAQKIGEEQVHEGEDLESLRDREASFIAQSRMRDFVESEDGKSIFIRDTCGFLLASLKHGLEPAARELVQQGLVLLWSAFEVLCRDAFETLLNEQPTKIQELVIHPKTRKRFEAESLSLETLVHHGFDLSGRLGTVLVGQNDFSDLPTVKAVYGVLFPTSTALNEAFGRRELWMLYQRRHLFVHRRGIIDQAYPDATGESCTVGTPLVVTPDDFEAALNVVAAAGTALAGCLPMNIAAQQRLAADAPIASSS